MPLPDEKKGSAQIGKSSSKDTTPAPVKVVKPAVPAAGEIKRAAPSPAPAQLSPFIAEHTVAAGDTISALAQEYYGKSTQKLWDEIVKANPQLKGDARGAKIGMALKIPRIPGYERTTPKGTPVIAYRTVKSSADTISALAQEYYGKSTQKHWDVILEANEEKLHGDPKRLKIGMMLYIPALPEDMR
ncbi:MAG: hypothetical protein FD147_2227 [Chloroflexi bacterium]|nr:MAG: hypothetical protein FD147_2227 [Chloroflexota bacterium]MBA4375960.1 hypothetical protein [Anaerolinea sp.]